MRSHGMSRSRPRRVGTRHEGDSPGHGDCRSSFLEPPGRSFLCARDQKPEKARGSCRSRGRQERAHRSLENRQPGFPQLPPALSSFSGNRKKCHPCSRLTLLPMFPVAPVRLPRCLMQHVARPPVSMSPKGAVRAGLTIRIVRPFFMRTTDDPVSHNDRLRPLRLDEVEDLEPDGRVRAHIGLGGKPPFQG